MTDYEPTPVIILGAGFILVGLIEAASGRSLIFSTVAIIMGAAIVGYGIRLRKKRGDGR